MSSKQINFFLVQGDLSEVTDFFFQNECRVLKRKNNLPSVSDDYDILQNQGEVFQVYLYRKKDSDQIYYEEINAKEYYIDIVKSHCVEFSIGGFYPYSDKELHSSRLYYVFEYYNAGKLIKKDEEFIQWSDNLIKNFKKRFLRRAPEYTNDFISEKFEEWVKVNDAKKTLDGTKFIIK
ncbi:MAG: hypothetical protein ACTHMV_12120 [Chitinophagaceae bacterium]